MSKFSFFLFLLIASLFACKNDAPANGEATNEAVTSGTGNQNGAGQSATGTTPGMTDNGSGSFSSGTNSGDTKDNIISSDGSGTVYTSGSGQPGGSKSAPVTTSSNSDADKILFGKKRASETYTTIIPDDTKTGKGPGLLPIPDPCTMLTANYLGTTFALNALPEIKSGSKKPQPSEKSCFFRFEDPKKPNGGIMLQIMTNPYPDEIPDYPELVIKGKIEDGEQVPYDKKVIKFKPFNDLGDGGCYSYEAGKYHWKIKDQYVFLLAFNTSHDEATQKQLAVKIGKEIMRNFRPK
ncbi:MAG: hypothetical protein IPN29_08490 [Saprospiraceae bacterium]|nr:hypothetical protein [Saprospiraceae bacterium]